MQIFKTIREHLVAIGFTKPDVGFHTEQVLRTSQGFLAIVLQCIHLLFEANTSKDFLDSLFTTAVGILVYMAYLSTVLKTKKIFMFINRLEKVIDGRLKYARSKAMYEKTNRLVEKISKFISFVIVYVSIPGFVLPKAFYCFFIYFTTDLEPNAFELPIPTWFPFDWKNPVGYSVAVFLCIQITAIPFRYIRTFLALGAGSFLMSLTVAEDIQCNLNAINDSIQSEQPRDLILGQINEFIRFTNIKRLVSLFSEIYQITLVIVFLGSTGAICLTLLMIQIDLAEFNNEHNTVVLLVSIFFGIWSINLVLVICEFGQKLSDEYEEIDNVLNRLDWYLLPSDIQKMLPIIFAYCQDPLIVNFFGSVSVSRWQFKKVINAGYTYFMVLRAFY